VEEPVRNGTSFNNVDFKASVDIKVPGLLFDEAFILNKRSRAVFYEFTKPTLFPTADEQLSLVSH